MFITTPHSKAAKKIVAPLDLGHLRLEFGAMAVHVAVLLCKL